MLVYLVATKKALDMLDDTKIVLVPDKGIASLVCMKHTNTGDIYYIKKSLLNVENMKA